MGMVIVDGQEIEVGDRERLNGIQVARRAGIEIPHYCWHPGLSVVGSCRMCLVEVGTRDPQTGRIAMLPKLVPACNTPAKDGTVFVTNSQKVQSARAIVEEQLLLRHPIDCPICDKAGECSLQDYYFKHGQAERRADLHPFTSRRRDAGPEITLFVDRCVLCSRCVRFTREVSGSSELMVVRRGIHEEIDVLPSVPLSSKLSGNVVDLCPVGALGDKDFLYRQRAWFLQKHPGVCTACATGCSIWVEENQDRVYRIRPRENPHVNQWWICNQGRYGYHHVHSDQRLVRARRRDGREVIALDWAGLPGELLARLRRSGRLAAVLSPYLTVEEAYLLGTLIRRLDPQAALALGPVPAAGDDERFPTRFTIRGEKCPNRRGVEKILAHFTGRASTFDELLARLEQGEIRGAWVSGGYKAPWIDASTAARFGGLELLVVQDLFPSPLAQLATYELPGAAFPERDGSYVNHADRLQSVRKAIRPPSGVRPEGSLYWELLTLTGPAPAGNSGQQAETEDAQDFPPLRITGPYDAREVLDHLARRILYFAPAVGPVPELGIDLKVNLLAAAETSGGQETA